MPRGRSGKDVVITRRGTPIARMSAVEPSKKRMNLNAIDEFRSELVPAKRPSTVMLRKMRDERY